MWTSLYILVLSAPFASVAVVGGFQIPIMVYRPPVKSSVSKLLHGSGGPNKGGISPPRGGGGGASSGVQNAHAIAYGAPPPASASTSVSSFERRMREIVLGKSRPSSKSLVDSLPEAPLPLPSNVHLVQTLADYKKLVGEETSRMVVVRFYASWCRVRGPSADSFPV
jgi:hypothetical protein